MYISQDPIGMEGGITLYGYVHDTNGWIDILGLAASCKAGSTTKIHGNSKNSTKPNHVYVIVDTYTGKMMKVGISGQTLNKNGSSPRANRQVNKLNATQPNRYKPVVVEKNKSRKQALDSEQKITDKHGARNDGKQPSPIHVRPKAQASTREEYIDIYGESDNRN